MPDVVSMNMQDWQGLQAIRLWRVGACTVDLDRQLLVAGGQPVELRPKAWELLCLLLQRPNGVVRSDELLDALWPRQEVLPKALVNLVSELRGRLGDTAVLRAVPRRGYVLQAAPEPGARAAAEPRRGAADTFVGRHRELDRCRVLAAEAAAHGLRLLALHGPAGVGKTTLARQAVARLRNQGWTVLSGACVETTGPREPFAPLLQALQEWGQGEGAAATQALEQCAPGWLALLPGLLDAGHWARLREGLAGAGSARMSREGVALLKHLGTRGPVALVIEDLHWADAATLDLLMAMLPAATELPLLVVLSWRTQELPEGLAVLVSRLEAAPLNEVVHPCELPCFSEDEIAAYVTRRLPALPLTGGARTELARLTAGLPLFLKLLCDDGQDLLPPGRDTAAAPTVKDLAARLRRHVHARVARLPSALRSLIEVASCMTAPAPLPVLAQVLDMDETQAQEGCSTLVDLGLFEKAAMGHAWPGARMVASYGPAHAVFRQAVAERLSPEARRTLNRGIALALKAPAEMPGSGMVAQRVQACIAAGLNVEAAQILRDPHARWLGRFHHRPAVQALAEALDLLADADDADADAVNARVAVCRRIVDLVPYGSERDRPLLARANARLLQDTALRQDAAGRSVHDRTACMRFLNEGRADLAQPPARALLQVSRDLDVVQQSAAQSCTLYVAHAHGDHAGVLQAGREILTLLDEHQGKPEWAPWMGRVQLFISQALACTGRLDPFRARLGAFLASGGPQQVPTLQGFVAVCLAWTLVQFGCMDLAAVLYQGVLDSPEDREVPWSINEAWLGLLACQPARQRPLEPLREWLARSTARAPLQCDHLARLLAVESLLARRRWAEAATELEAAADTATHWPALHSELLRLRGQLALGRQLPAVAQRLWQQALDIDIAKRHLPGALRSVAWLHDAGLGGPAAVLRCSEAFPEWLDTELGGEGLAPLSPLVQLQQRHRELLREARSAAVVLRPL